MTEEIQNNTLYSKEHELEKVITFEYLEVVVVENIMMRWQTEQKANQIYYSVIKSVKIIHRLQHNERNR